MSRFIQLHIICIAYDHEDALSWWEFYCFTPNDDGVKKGRKVFGNNCNKLLSVCTLHVFFVIRLIAPCYWHWHWHWRADATSVTDKSNESFTAERETKGWKRSTFFFNNLQLKLSIDTCYTQMINHVMINCWEPSEWACVLWRERGRERVQWDGLLWEN